MPELAHDSLTSLMDTIKGLLRFSSLKVLIPAFDSVVYLRGTLEWNSQGVGDLDEQMIMEAARKLEDAIEFSLLSAQPPTFSFNLDDDINCFFETAKERNQIITWKDKQSKPDQQEVEEEAEKEEEEEEEDEEEVEMVGLCDEFLYIRHKVLTVNEQTDFRYSRENVIWLEGMAGVGKTALTKKVFHDPSVKTEFESRALVRVGLNYGSSERFLEAIRDQLNLDNGGMTLVVLDDVWEPHLIYSLQDSIQSSKEGQIVILVTSRIHENFGFCFPINMRLMDTKESWELLRRKVFGEEEEYCPPQLVKPGKKIAEKCEGLPLLINAVAPILLSKAQKDPECWNTITQDIKNCYELKKRVFCKLLGETARLSCMPNSPLIHPPTTNYLGMFSLVVVF